MSKIPSAEVDFQKKFAVVENPPWIGGNSGILASLLIHIFHSVIRTESVFDVIKIGHREARIEY
jgi:hypothetical protein